MPRYEVDRHPQRERIIKALIRGNRSLRDIGGQFGISKSALQRYLTRELIERAAKTEEARKLKDGQAVMRHLEEALESSSKMRRSCDVYLQDPDDPDLYYLGPREEDVEVLCVIRNDEGKIVARKKAELSKLLAYVEAKLDDDDLEIEQWHWRHADPRDLILKSAMAINKHLELAARLLGEIKEGGDVTLNINVLNTPVFIQMRQIIMESTAEYPEVRKEIARRLNELSISSNSG